MNKATLINWLREQQPKLETILLNSAEEYYKKYSSNSTFAFDFDAKKTGEEMWALSKGEDLCYDRPTIGFNYSLWYHPKRINTFLRYFTDLIYDARNEDTIEIFDLGAGTGAVLWSVGLVVSGLKTLGLPCPKIRIVNVDTSAFMLFYNYNYLWKNFVTEFPLAEEVSKKDDYLLNSWSNLDEANCTNIWLCASYLFDHSENATSIEEEFKGIVTKYRPNRVLLLSALQKRPFVDAVADAIQTLNYAGYNSVLTNQIFSGGLNRLYEFRNRISQLHSLGLSGVPQWNIDSLYGRVLVNNNPKLGLNFENITLFVQPQRNRVKIKLTPQQEDAATINNRPTLVIGPAGCGKSVVLTQKIKNLILSTRIGNDYNPNLKILVTTFNKGLVRYLSNWIAELLDEGKFTRRFGTDFYGREQDHSFFTFSNSQRVNIYVMHFDILPTKVGNIAWRHVSLNGANIEQFHADKMNMAINAYITINNINRNEFSTILNAEFLLDEYQRVIYGFECINEKQYQTVERTGRGKKPQLRYDSKRRSIIWGIIRTYLQDLRDNQVESFIIRRHRLIKKLRAEGFQNKFSHILVDEFQDCTKADYEIFYAILENHNNITFAGDYAQSINLGSSTYNPLRSASDEMKRFLPKRLSGSFRLPMRISECLIELSRRVNKKYTDTFGADAGLINPYKGAPPGSRPIFVFAQDTNAAALKIKEIFFTYKKPLNLDRVTIFERDRELNTALCQNQTPTETEIILKAKGLEKNCVVWSTRISVDTTTEKEEFIYTILTRTVSLLVVVVFPNLKQDYIDIIKTFVPNRIICWDEDSENAYLQLKNTDEKINEEDDEDNSEDTETNDENEIDTLIV